MIHYTGIGSRNTPNSVLEHMVFVASEYAKRGYVLRSGGAKGADSAFEAGCDSVGGQKEIYIPWDGFNDLRQDQGYIVGNNQSRAESIASRLHPAWHRCSSGARKLHARNAYQVLGEALTTPSNLVVCWTLDGAEVGGTGQAIRLARHFGIYIVNFGNKRWHVQNGGW